MKQITEKEIAKQIAELINKNVNQIKKDDEKNELLFSHYLCKNNKNFWGKFFFSVLKVNFQASETYLVIFLDKNGSEFGKFRLIGNFWD